MTQADQKTTSQDPAPIVPADVLMSVLGEQVGALYSLAQELEASLSETLSVTERLSSDAFRTIQRVDYLRQSLKDIGAIMTHIGDGVEWAEGSEVRLNELHSLVDMRDSLDGLQVAKPTANAVHDIWL